MMPDFPSLACILIITLHFEAFDTFIKQLVHAICACSRAIKHILLEALGQLPAALRYIL